MTGRSAAQRRKLPRREFVPELVKEVLNGAGAESVHSVYFLAAPISTGLATPGFCENPDGLTEAPEKP